MVKNTCRFYSFNYNLNSIKNKPKKIHQTLVGNMKSKELKPKGFFVSSFTL